VSEEDAIARRRAELVSTDERLGLEVSLATAQAEVRRLRRRVRSLEAQLSAGGTPPPREAGLRSRLGAGLRRVRR
jgi:hypothetical protein